jgi:hypothetical protein
VEKEATLGLVAEISQIPVFQDWADSRISFFILVELGK